MKKVSVFLAIIFTAGILIAQSSYVPYAELKTIDGLPITTEEIIEEGVVTILVFFKSFNKQCSESLDEMQDIWQNSLDGQGVKLIAICVDGVGGLDHIKPFVYGNAWDFDTYIDVNCDLKRAMSVGNLPCTILLDDSENLICRHDGFYTGSETIFCEKVQEHLYAVLD
jgi:cytochrome c biogenesis protein CcmG/thiol:disulfide interchange protein DsbE